MKGYNASEIGNGMGQQIVWSRLFTMTLRWYIDDNNDAIFIWTDQNCKMDLKPTLTEGSHEYNLFFETFGRSRLLNLTMTTNNASISKTNQK